MSKKLSEQGSVQLALRVPPEVAEEVDTIAKELEKRGPSWSRPTRADVLREALTRGLAVLRKELARKRR